MQSFPPVPTRRFWRRSGHQEVKPKPGMPAKPCRWRALHLARPLMVFLCGASPAANAVVPGTDANVVTAIDVSDSIGRYEEWLQQAGLVRALVHPDFLRAATAGPRRRIGFAVFTWSSDGKFDLLVPWTVIGSAEDAARVSQALASVTLIDRTHYGGGDMEQDGDADPAAVHDRLTDMSEAIDFASLLLTSSPHAMERAVMNICANGTDNFAGGTESSRDAALAQGFTINRLVRGQDAELAQYFRSSVIGGPGAFAMDISEAKDAGEFMTRKHVRDLLASAPAGAPRFRIE
ncbi:MAG: DUF1194 domain-containing protein [Mesorhizobium sp.]|nr:MAG: DUF1194 domain-containing protein [Mesorhizobium sp.]RWN79195.1 MAG: DUF1194 domain-containing protein [Mesorhizobium sp.]RWN84752.1 MAG: DUF1194 domain-containing protein [Mesorhizobium sp.]RWN92871.1 MAG: DUF1194 domain-containing protein [Mesorhizobium sp.]RWO17327.1 MAG: DUF1194 domain-containing protein [Mesorhizobium sp.]